jgi:eukaryotic-like serine/threonine-protein kinase
MIRAVAICIAYPPDPRTTTWAGSTKPQQCGDAHSKFGLMGLPTLILGTATFFTGHYAESVGPFEKAAELEPQVYWIWGNLADAYRWTPGKQDRAKATYARAIGLAEQALEVNPRDTDALDSLAMYEAKSGGLEKARLLIGRALAIAPSDLDVLIHAVEVYTLAGEQRKALDCLKSAVQGGYPRFEIEANPELASLRSDPRYREIMAEAKTPR